MKFTFVPLNEVYSRTIVDSWKYEPPYDVFNYDKEAEVMSNRLRWGTFQFAVLDEAGRLVGELNTEFYDANEQYLNSWQEGATLWIGFGMHPDLTGQGLGLSFVDACLDHSVEHHKYIGQYVYLATGVFNQRGIKVYRKSGFLEVPSPSAEVVWMRRLVSTESSAKEA